MPANLAQAARDRDRRKKIARIKGTHGLWYLLTQILGYKWNAKAGGGDSPFAGRGMVYRLHRPVCDWQDAHRGDLQAFMQMERGAHKTTIVVGQIIQSWVLNPNTRVHYYHNVDEQAEGVCGEVKDLLLECKALRALEPIGQEWEDGVLVREYNIIPRKGKWYTTSTIKLNAPLKKSRGPHLLCKGIKSEVTGSHCDLVFLDDIISRSTIDNSELPKIKSTVESTILPVVDTKKIRASGTPWSHEGIYSEWEQSRDWWTLKIPGSVDSDDAVSSADWESRHIHLEPDYSKSHPTYGPPEYLKTAIRRLKWNERNMKGHFAPQVMLDPTPQSERPWIQEECEHYTSVKRQGEMPGIGGAGRLFVLSDPAPYLQGSYKGLTEKQRGDGTKDYWSICVVKLRNRGDVQDIILLDGRRSQDWREKEGAEVCTELLKKWRVKTGATPVWISEQADAHFPHMQGACRRLGVQLIQARKGGPVKYKEYNKKDGKNVRFNRMAERAKNHELWICNETCPSEFLEGDGNRTGFLTQSRKWVRVSLGYNSLRYDDDADVVSRACDEALLEFAPLPMVETMEDIFAEWRQEDDQQANPARSRYCGM